MAKKVNLPSLVSGTVNAGLAAASTTTNSTTLRNGSTGNQVKNLQAALAEQGYDVGNLDGVYGQKTEAAVKQYQKDNGLTVDGIAGKNTLGSLNSSANAQKVNIDSATAASGPIISASIAAGTKPNLPSLPTTNTQPETETKKDVPAAKAPETTKTETPAATAAATTPTTGGTVAQPAAVTQPFSYDEFNYGKDFTYDDFSYDKQFTYDDFSYGDFSYADYAESEAVKQANALLQQQIAAKPGAYQSQWQNQINDYMNQIENREAFSYDPNSDALYNMYKDLYVQQGKMAMMDTMGQAASMTGGYGNSYAQTVGQQAYNQQLSQLNNVLPELYQQSYNRYADEGQRLQDMYNMYLGREEQDYGRYVDEFNAWQAERDYLANRYDYERDYDYSKWESNRNLAYDQYTSDRNLAYDQWSSDRDLAYDQYTSDRNLAYDQWSSGRELAYDQYTADKNLAYDQYSAGRETAWQEYLNNLEKEQAAAELMAGADSYDRLASLYGLSADEVTALKDANAPKVTGSTNPDTDLDTEPEYDNGGLSVEQIKNIQRSLGVEADGLWGPDSQEAAGGLGAKDAYDAWNKGKLGKPVGTAADFHDAGDGTGLTVGRQKNIENWIATAIANANSSRFNVMDVIAGSSYLKTDEERVYAYAVAEYLSSLK